MTKGKLILITGPSGVGKGTLVKELLKRYPQLYLSVSATTRSPRPGEVEGQHYFFLPQSKFQTMIRNGEFLEWAEYAGNFYGTPRQQVERQLEEGHQVILEIELLGARQIKKNFPDTLSLFILPPSVIELERRLKTRANDSAQSINRRLERAQLEIEAVDEFDYQIINDDLEEALQSIEAAIFG